jgi:acyl-CoA thioester hydrolase
MYISKTTYRVPYADTDQMTYMYYGHYPKLYEMGRAEMVRELGITYKDLEKIHKISMPVLELNCRYKTPAFYDDLLTIESKLEEMPTKLICFHHKVFNEVGDLLNKGFVKLFFIDQETSKRISAPAILTDKLRPYFG